VCGGRISYPAWGAGTARIRAHRRSSRQRGAGHRPTAVPAGPRCHPHRETPAISGTTTPVPESL